MHDRTPDACHHMSCAGDGANSSAVSACRLSSAAVATMLMCRWPPHVMCRGRCQQAAMQLQDSLTCSIKPMLTIPKSSASTPAMRHSVIALHAWPGHLLLSARGEGTRIGQATCAPVAVAAQEREQEANSNVHNGIDLQVHFEDSKISRCCRRPLQAGQRCTRLRVVQVVGLHMAVWDCLRRVPTMPELSL